MKLMLIALFLSVCFLSGYVYSTINAKPDYQDWRIAVVAPPGAFLVFSYASPKWPEGRVLRAVIVYESSTHYRLVGGIGLHKDVVKKTMTDAVVVLPISYQE